MLFLGCLRMCIRMLSSPMGNSAACAKLSCNKYIDPDPGPDPDPCAYPDADLDPDPNIDAYLHAGADPDADADAYPD